MHHAVRMFLTTYPPSPSPSRSIPHRQFTVLFWDQSRPSRSFEADGLSGEQLLKFLALIKPNIDRIGLQLVGIIPTADIPSAASLKYVLVQLKCLIYACYEFTFK